MTDQERKAFTVAAKSADMDDLAAQIEACRDPTKHAILVLVWTRRRKKIRLRQARAKALAALQPKPTSI